MLALQPAHRFQAGFDAGNGGTEVPRGLKPAPHFFFSAPCRAAMVRVKRRMAFIGGIISGSAQRSTFHYTVRFNGRPRAKRKANPPASDGSPPLIPGYSLHLLPV